MISFREFLQSLSCTKFTTHSSPAGGSLGAGSHALRAYSRDATRATRAAAARGRSATNNSAPFEFLMKTPNAGSEPRPIAGATEERKLSGVGSSAWLGAVRAQCCASGTTLYQPLLRLHLQRPRQYRTASSILLSAAPVTRP